MKRSKKKKKNESLSDRPVKNAVKLCVCFYEHVDRIHRRILFHALMYDNEKVFLRFFEIDK